MVDHQAACLHQVDLDILISGASRRSNTSWALYNAEGSALLELAPFRDLEVAELAEKEAKWPGNRKLVL